MLKRMAKKIILVQRTLPFMNKKHFSPFSACETSDNSLLDGLLVSDTQRLRAMNKTSHFSLMNIPNRDSTSASPPDSLLALAPWLPWSTWKHADYYAGVCAWRGGGSCHWRKMINRKMQHYTVQAAGWCLNPKQSWAAVCPMWALFSSLIWSCWLVKETNGEERA